MMPTHWVLLDKCPLVQRTSSNPRRIEQVHAVGKKEKLYPRGYTYYRVSVAVITLHYTDKTNTSLWKENTFKTETFLR